MKTKRTPYYDTTVPPERTQAEISKLLYEYGAEAVRWTTTRAGQSQIEFVLKMQTAGTMQQRITVRVSPPVFAKRDGTQNQAQSMRLLHWWLKSKLEAVYYGLTTVESEFLAEIVGALPDGSSATIGDLIVPKIRGGAIDSGELLRALPAKKETVSQ
jgi:hypothetical protein